MDRKLTNNQFISKNTKKDEKSKSLIFEKMDEFSKLSFSEFKIDQKIDKNSSIKRVKVEEYKTLSSIKSKKGGVYQRFKKISGRKNTAEKTEKIKKNCYLSDRCQEGFFLVKKNFEGEEFLMNNNPNIRLENFSSSRTKLNILDDDDEKEKKSWSKIKKSEGKKKIDKSEKFLINEKKSFKAIPKKKQPQRIEKKAKTQITFFMAEKSLNSKVKSTACSTVYIELTEEEKLLELSKNQNFGKKRNLRNSTKTCCSTPEGKKSKISQKGKIKNFEENEIFGCEQLEGQEYSEVIYRRGWRYQSTKFLKKKN